MARLSPTRGSSMLPACPRVGTVDARFQSYNIEMIEITGGKFWKPYRSKQDGGPAPEPRSGSDTPPGMDSSLYQYRPPIDLTRARLRKLAAALGPSYLRVSGTWANTTYFADSDTPPATPPAGFGGVLTRPQWRGVVDFAKAADARDRDVIRHQSGHPRRLGCLETGSGASPCSPIPARSEAASPRRSS